MDAVFAVGEVFLYDMPAVGCRCNHHVGAALVDAPFQPRFERGHFFVPLLEGKVVDEQDKFERQGGEYLLDLVDQADLFLGYLHAPQSLPGILVQHGVYGGRFARSLVPVQQHIGVGQSADEIDDIVLDGSLFFFVVFQVAQGDFRRVEYRLQVFAVKSKRLVPDKDAVPVFAVEPSKFSDRIVRCPVPAEQGIIFAVADCRESFFRCAADFVGQVLCFFGKFLQDAQVVCHGGAQRLRRRGCAGAAGEQAVLPQDESGNISGKRILHVRFEQDSVGAGVRADASARQCLRQCRNGFVAQYAAQEYQPLGIQVVHVICSPFGITQYYTVFFARMQINGGISRKSEKIFCAAVPLWSYSIFR